MSDSNDQEGHELTFDEWKLANIEIASALKLPSKDVKGKFPWAGGGFE